MARKKAKDRHKCHRCGATKYGKYMERVNDWHQGQWECANKEMCELRRKGKGGVHINHRA